MNPSQQRPAMYLLGMLHAIESYDRADLYCRGINELPEEERQHWRDRFAKAEQWQPIETAPKDVPVLFFTPADEETGYLAFQQVSYIDSEGLHTYNVSQWEDGLRPTHWRPLSAPPEVQS